MSKEQFQHFLRDVSLPYSITKALGMVINWFWDTLQCKGPDPKTSVLLASKGMQLSFKDLFLEAAGGALYASGSHFVCDQTREL